MSTLDIIVFCLASVGLFYSGGAVVHSLVWIGHYLRVSEYLLALLLVAFATSLDELLVGMSLAFHDAPIASLGNFVGANVLNMTLILGEAILLADWERRRSGVPRVLLPDESGGDSERRISRIDMLLILGMVVLPLLLLLDGTLGRTDGALLILSFAGFAYYLFREERVGRTFHSIHEFFPGVYRVEGGGSAVRKRHTRYSLWTGVLNVFEFNPVNLIKNLILFTGGLAILLISAWVISSTGILFASELGMPLFFIGIAVAVGTTLPEAAFNMRTIVAHHDAMALGNTLGSVVVNTSLFLGIVALLRPITLSDTSGAVFAILLAAGFVLMTEVLSALHITFPRFLGVALILLSFVFIFIEYVL